MAVRASAAQEFVELTKLTEHPITPDLAEQHWPAWCADNALLSSPVGCDAAIPSTYVFCVPPSACPCRYLQDKGQGPGLKCLRTLGVEASQWREGLLRTRVLLMRNSVSALVPADLLSPEYVG
jgi:hypothetical protein